MADPIIINPILTLAGQAAAFNASNDGLELKITHVSFGTAHYDPTGEELALVAPVGNKVPVAGASRPTPYQIRMVSAWREDVGQVGIGEIAFWAGDTLAFVWSKADGTVASYKTNGVTYVLFNDLAFSAVPANSISFVIDPDESVALAALAAHEGAYNAHPQYVLRAKFPDYQGHLWGDVGGSANAITLTLPEIVELTQYIKGNRFSFKALSDNTGDTTINVEGVGPVQVLKTGGVPLTAGSIVAGGVYDVYYDGAKFQLTAGAGFASAEATEAEVTDLTATDSTSWLSVRRLIKALLSFAKLSGATFTGDVKGVTPAQFDNDTSFITSAFVKRMGLEYGDYTNYGATAALTAADIGKVAAFAGAGAMIATLPTGPLIPRGAVVKILCGMGTLTVKAAAGDSIDAVNYVGNISMAQGDTAEFVRIGSLWRLIGGSVSLGYSAYFSTVTKRQANSLDTTAGALMAVGAFGAGQAVLSTEVDMDKYQIPGNYLTPLAGLLHLPAGWPPSTRYSLVVTGYSSNNYLVQTLTSGMAENTIPAVAIRTMSTAGIWSEWQQALGKGSLNSWKSISDTVSLTAADCGVLLVGGAGLSGKTVTLPPTASVALGHCIHFSAGQNPAPLIIAAAAGETISPGIGGATSTASFEMDSLDSVTLVCLGGSSGWRMVGGSQFNKHTRQFACDIAASGHQTFPGGLIRQWGTFPATSVGAGAYASLTITLPKAFPNGYHHGNGSVNNQGLCNAQPRPNGSSKTSIILVVNNQSTVTLTPAGTWEVWGN